MRPLLTTTSTVLHVITGLNRGGAEATLYSLTSHDPQSEHHVVSLMDEGVYGSLLRSAGISVTPLNMPRGKVTIRGIVKLFALMKRTKPDVVQTWMYHADLVGGVVAKLAGVRNVSWGIRHSFLLPGESKSSTIFISKLNALLSRVVPNTIVCCAAKALEAHAEIGYHRSKMTVIPNGYDTSVYFPDTTKRDAIRSSLNIGDEEPLIGFVARFDPLKDHHTLITALAIVQSEIPNTKALLIGAGIDGGNDSLVSMLESANLTSKVTLLGRRDDIPAIMNALDLHVMSSSSEAFPNVLAEAMACGTPCVATDVGDSQTIIGDTGWLVSPKDPEQLARAIIDALNERNTDEWNDRRKRAIERVQDNFQVGTMVRRYRSEAWQLTEDIER